MGPRALLSLLSPPCFLPACETHVVLSSVGKPRVRGPGNPHPIACSWWSGAQLRLAGCKHLPAGVLKHLYRNHPAVSAIPSHSGRTLWPATGHLHLPWPGPSATTSTWAI